MLKKKKFASLFLVLIVLFLIPTYAFASESDYSGHWAENTIKDWIDNGYINGYPDGSFNPEGLVTRAEFIKMVNSYFGFTEVVDINFTDVTSTEWYYSEVQKAFKVGYITGISEQKFDPNNSITREQAAVIISKITNSSTDYGNENIFIDSGNISLWAKDHVLLASNNQLIKGYPDNSFRPQNNVKRAEAVEMLNRLLINEEPVEAKEISLNLNSTMVINIPNKSSLFSSDEQIATVDSEGTITSINPGVTIISTIDKGRKNDIYQLTVTEPSLRTIKILSIGNSFSQDMVYYLYDIAKSAGVNLVIGNLYNSGCSLERHWNYAINDDKAAYIYYKWDSTGFYETGNLSMKEVLQDENWDYITFQQSSGFSGIFDTYQPFLNNLTSYAKGMALNPNVKLALNMTWAYSSNSNNENFIYYHYDQNTMYDAIINSNKKASRETIVDFVIPFGTAIQNARTNRNLIAVGNELTSDGYHLDIGIGRYIAGLTMLESIAKEEGLKIDIIKDVNFKPIANDKKDTLTKLAKKSANYAVNNPFNVQIIK